MAIIAKSILVGYNRCAELAQKWVNILDSYRHKHEQITIDDLDFDPKTYVESGAPNVEITGTGVQTDPYKFFVEQLAVADNLTTNNTEAALSAAQGVILKGMIDSITALLSSDNVNLDELQEVVDFIEANREDLENLSINNIAGLTAALDSKLNVADAPKYQFQPYTIGEVLTPNMGKIIRVAENSLHLYQGTFEQANNTFTCADFDEEANQTPYRWLKLIDLKLIVGNQDGVEQFSINLPSQINFEGALYKPSENKVVFPYPAPFIREVVTKSMMPNENGEIEIHGDFNIPEMATELFNQQSVQDCVLHSIRFFSSQIIFLNITASANLINPTITLFNGKQTVIENAFVITNGVLFIPKETDYESVSPSIDVVQDGYIKIKARDYIGSAILKASSLKFEVNEDFIVQWNWKNSPLEPEPNAIGYDVIGLYDDALCQTANRRYRMRLIKTSYSLMQCFSNDGNTETSHHFSISSDMSEVYSNTYAIKRIGGIVTFWENDVQKKVASHAFTGELFLKFDNREFNTENIKIFKL